MGAKMSISAVVVEESATEKWKTEHIRFFKSGDEYIALHNAPSIPIDEVKVPSGKQGGLGRFISYGDSITKYKKYKLKEVSLESIDINKIIFMEAE